MGNKPSKVLPPTSDFELVHSCEPSERYLGENTDALPSREAGRPIRIYINSGNDSSAVLVTETHSDYAGGMQLRRHKRRERRPMEIIGRDGMVMAVCAKNLSGGRKPVAQIYGTRPRYERQQPANEGKGFRDFICQYDYPLLYTWATVEGEKSNSFGNHIRMVEGREGHDGVMYRTELVESPIGPQIAIWKEDKPAAAILTRHIGGAWEMTISPGIDPVLIICLSAFMEEQERIRGNSSHLASVDCCNGLDCPTDCMLC